MRGFNPWRERVRVTMDDISIVIELDKKLKKLLAEGDKDLEKELWWALIEGGQNIKGTVQDLTPHGVTGHLRRDTFFEPRRDAGEMTGIVGNPSVYVLPVEEGTRPHWPPMEPLVQWVRRVLGIMEDDKAVAVAKLIQYKIAAHGTKGKTMFRSAFQLREPEVQRRFNRAVGNFINGA